MKKQKAQEIEEQIPEGLKKSLIRRAKRSTKKEDFDIEKEILDIINNNLELYNHLTKDRVFDKFSDMMFKRYKQNMSQ